MRQVTDLKTLILALTELGPDMSTVSYDMEADAESELQEIERQRQATTHFIDWMKTNLPNEEGTIFAEMVEEAFEEAVVDQMSRANDVLDEFGGPNPNDEHRLDAHDYGVGQHGAFAR